MDAHQSRKLLNRQSTLFNACAYFHSVERNWRFIVALLDHLLSASVGEILESGKYSALAQRATDVFQSDHV
jgi:hypothetical protein